MNTNRSSRAAAFAGLVLLGGISAGVFTGAQAVGVVPVAQSPGIWSSWSALRYDARPLLFFHGQVSMRLRGTGPVRQLETDTSATFLGAELARARSRTTFDAATGRTKEFYELTPERGRRYVFGEHSYTVERLKPVGGWEAPVEQWKSSSTKTWSYPPAAAGGAAPFVYDYYGMILSLSRAPLRAPGDSVNLWVATSNGPRAYVVSVGEVRNSTRALGGASGAGSRSVPVRELRLRVVPADPAKAEEGFLKMEGETEIWVESASRTLLQVSGRIPNVPGRVDVELTGVE
jgi:hypothetical protein